MTQAIGETFRVHVWTGAPGIHDTRGFKRISNAIAWAKLWQDDTLRDNGLTWTMASIAVIGANGETRVPRIWERYAIMAPGEDSPTDMFVDDRRDRKPNQWQTTRRAVPIVWRDRSPARAGD